MERLGEFRGGDGRSPRGQRRADRLRLLGELLRPGSLDRLGPLRLGLLGDVFDEGPLRRRLVAGQCSLSATDLAAEECHHMASKSGDEPLKTQIFGRVRDLCLDFAGGEGQARPSIEPVEYQPPAE